jgi:hypothetical protein
MIMTRKLTGLTLVLSAALAAGLLTLTTGCDSGGGKSEVKVDPNVQVKPQPTAGGARGNAAAPPKAQ